MMVWVACSAMVVLIGIYVFVPLFRKAEGDLEVELEAETELDRLLGRKATVYGNLRDLQFEYGMGRLSEADFRQLEKSYKSEAAAVLRKLESSAASGEVDEVIEREIASRKSRSSTPGSNSEMERSHCPSCGAQAIPGKNFCADCGHSLENNQGKS